MKCLLILQNKTFFLATIFASILFIGFSQPSADKTVSLKIDSLILPLVQSNNYAGNVLVAMGDRIIFSQSYGKRDFNMPVDHDQESRFFLCSASMIFTSAAVLKLVDEGKLSLDDPLSKFLPNFKRANEITIHHMLAERSGIPAIGSAGGVRRALLLNYQQKPHSSQDLVDYVRNYDLLFDPGTAYNHGRSEYNILAYIIEQTSGMNFGEYLQVSIFEPLGMLNSGHYGNEANQIVHLAAGHAPQGFKDLEYADKIHWSSKTGHASIYSTAEDLYKFGQAVLQGKLLSQTSWKNIFTDHGDHWGYGWVVSSQHGYPKAYITGRSPGYSSYLGIYPSKDMMVIMLSNIYISLPHFVGPQIDAIVLEKNYEKLNLSIDPVEANLAKALTGTYQFGDFYRPGGKVKITFKDGKLYSDGHALIPVKEDQEIVKFIHRHYWSSLTFVKNEQGEYNQLQFDDYVGERVKGYIGGLSIIQIGLIALGVVLLGIMAIFALRQFGQGRLHSP